ncbi:hypothetical protein [Micromonospora wenchangensis]|uniref:hypothetical protein n=1 Tax=Micromonospora wenchangensis TaxID=1185415 RepID=UPI00344761B1
MDRISRGGDDRAELDVRIRRAGESAVLRRCVGLVRRLDRAVGIPRPFELEEFLDRWSRYRAGRPVSLFPMTDAELPANTCGLWLALPDRDIVGFPMAAPRNHRDHIVLHEVGHMLATHADGLAGPVDGFSGLVPDLDPAMVRSVLGRSAYDDVQEQEAELIASLIMHRSLTVAPRLPVAGRIGMVIERLERTLDR